MTPRPLTLSQDARDAWRRDGFLILEDFIDAEDVRKLKARMAEITSTLPLPGSTFETHTNAHADDAWFRDSGREVRAFVEDDDPAVINKVGHALHDRDPVFDGFCRQPRLAALAGTLGLTAPLLVQSMYIFKHPRVGGAVSWHQDSAYLYTDPPSVIGFWFALADATVENGCLRVVPGGHLGPLRRRFHYMAGELVHTDLDNSPWVEDEGGVVDLEVPAGALVVLHGNLPHSSRANRSEAPRPAFALHVIDGAARYADDNWLQRDDARPFTGFDTRKGARS